MTVITFSYFIVYYNRHLSWNAITSLTADQPFANITKLIKL